MSHTTPKHQSTMRNMYPTETSTVDKRPTRLLRTIGFQYIGVYRKRIDSQEILHCILLCPFYGRILLQMSDPTANMSASADHVNDVHDLIENSLCASRQKDSPGCIICTSLLRGGAYVRLPIEVFLLLQFSFCESRFRTI